MGHREVPNSTTEVAPYMLLYGSLPKGLFTILMDSRAGEHELPPNLGKSVAAYMQELKENLEITADFATKHGKAEQARYAEYNNRRTKDKHLNIGEKVLVLAPDSSIKIYYRWHVPCTITQVRAPYSYVVDMGDGSRRQLHPNRIRKFIVRTHLVGIIKEDDDEFEGVPLGPTGKYAPLCLPSQKLDMECLTYLDSVQRTELLHVLNQFPECFSDKSGLCELVTREIKVTPEFKPKQFKAYRVPEILEGEINRQIDELIKQVFIKPSKSPVASPIACVLKKDKSVRLTCDLLTSTQHPMVFQC